jgi:hypothetical protein
MFVFGCPMAAQVNSRKAFANPFVATINTVQAFWLAKSRTMKAKAANGN